MNYYLNEIKEIFAHRLSIWNYIGMGLLIIYGIVVYLYFRNVNVFHNPQYLLAFGMLLYGGSYLIGELFGN